ncbi:hypothetical protein GF386_05075 [Candidatus Pacearchaeota archaeon]|nr:hypothetical protein [Candidatus Pacearchaeota archaeon]MBD3283483.1 hypothetical protein [Candidatus Pacearchaeota archaeon]
MAYYEENLYPGADDYLFPKYKKAGYEFDIGDLGMSLDPRTANQLGEINTKINPGIKKIELSGITPAVFDSIPEEHLEDINRLSKLTGVKTSLHGPVVEASGVGERGFDETNRVGAEKQLQSAVLRSHKMDPDGEMIVTTHTSAGLPELDPKVKIKDDTGKMKEVPTGLYVVDEDTGKIQLIQPEKRFFPEEGEGKFNPKDLQDFDPNKELNKINKDQWAQLLSGVNRYASFGEEMLERVRKQVKNEELFTKIAKGVDIDQLEETEKQEKDLLKSLQREINGGQIYLRDAYRNLQVLFDKAWSNASPDDKKKLKTYADKIAPKIQKGIEDDPEKIPELAEVIEGGLKVLGRVETPRIFKPLRNFVIEKSSQTFANVAESSFNEYGKKAPILSIENPPAGGALSTGEDLKKVIEESRNRLIENLVKHKGMSKSEAKEVAGRLIGATWDVGHINMIRKKGYSEKDVIEETKKVAPFVKHVHLSDNFGLEHTELPMGMGNVPLDRMMKKLKKTGFDGQKIIEAGNWWQYFAEKGGGNPFRPSIEAFDSPLYSMKAGPGWSQLGGYGNYYVGHGPVNPPMHHQMYGASFSTLPTELGGELPGDRSRMSGTPNQ